MITVVRAGPLTTVQDLGRPGYAHLGVPPSGALDRPALDLANLLVGNQPGAAAIEALLGGVTLRAAGPCVVAVTGARVRVRLGASDIAFSSPVRLAAGDELRIGTPRAGLRCYLALSGGVDVAPELGSRSTDTLSALGPAPLSDGTVLPLGPAAPDHDVTSHRRERGVTSSPDDSGGTAGVIEVPVTVGPRERWFEEAAAQLDGGEWSVSPRSNRIGVRLEGTPLRRAGGAADELPTEPVITGAVQVPPSGQPLVFLNDHPTTGGYPVIAVVLPQALPLLAQARPGRRLRLRPVR